MKKRIFLTVDTECHDIGRINQYIYGKSSDGKEHGLREILEIGKELKIPINFFLDVSECRRYGDEYIQEIVELIKQYEQPIYFHFHPNFVSGDDSRSYLWQYSKEEQKELIYEGISDYIKFCGNKERIFFRAGRYGINDDTIQVLSELDIPIIDLSYSSGNGMGMCHLSKDKYGYHNIPSIYNGIVIFPNSSYVGFDYFGKVNHFLVNVAQTPYREFKRFIDSTNLNNVVYTMHSWDLIKKWFFCKDKVWGNNTIKKRFRKCIAYANEKGFVFSKLDDLSIENNSADELVNLCSGGGKFLELQYNFIRFWGIAHLTPKYFVIYATFAMIVVLAFIGTLLMLI